VRYKIKLLLALHSRAYGVRLASSEFADGASHSFAATYRRRAEGEPMHRFKQRSLTPWPSGGSNNPTSFFSSFWR